MTSDTLATPMKRKKKLRFRTHSLTSQLRAYADVVLSNLEANAVPGAERLKAGIQNALDEYLAGERDELSVFLAIKGFEYQAVRDLKFDSRQFAFFLEKDLEQTPATKEEVTELLRCFVPQYEGEKPKALEECDVAKVTHVAIGYWSRYAERILKAVIRDKYLAVALSLTLLIYLAGVIVAGVNEAFGGPSRLVAFLTTTPIIGFIALGCAGAIVSLSLASEGAAIAATRPLDNLYVFWSSIPRILMGSLAGLLATHTVFLVSPLADVPRDSERYIAVQVLQMFLAFTGGFADRLFLQKLVNMTWRLSGLTEKETK